MVNHGFFNGKKIYDLKNYILNKISVEMSSIIMAKIENLDFL